MDLRVQLDPLAQGELLHRQPARPVAGHQLRPPRELLDRFEAIPGSAFIAWHTLSKLYYVLATASSPAAARSFLSDVLAWADAAPVGQPEAKLALKLPQKDFEDCLQIASAEAAGATCIITRNKPDFRGAPIPALTPEEWLKQNP